VCVWLNEENFPAPVLCNSVFVVRTLDVPPFGLVVVVDPRLKDRMPYTGINCWRNYHV